MTAGADKLIAGSSLLIRIPKKMPNNWILKQIAFPPPKEDFFSRTGRLGKLLPPRISLEEQQQIRLTCKLAGIDPVKVVGLPAEELALQSAYSLYAKSDKTLVQVIRQKKIEENMAKMPKRIADWKEEKRKTKASAKPIMPF